MSKFNVGDRVRCLSVDNHSKGFVVGRIYTVKRFDDDLLYTEELERGMFDTRFELVKDEPMKTKLINSRPMSEFNPEPLRKILLINSSGDPVIVTSENPYIKDYSEWAEIMKPDPKPDANGWWNLKDKKPEHGQLVVQAFPGDIPGIVVRKWSDKNYVHTYTHWKLWEGPVED